MTVTDAELETFAASHDIITLGAAADDLRRSIHGPKTTFVRVADLDATPGTPVEVPAGAGELRIVGVPIDRAAAVSRVAEVLAVSASVPVSAFSLADLEELAARDRTPLRACLEELRSVGLEIIAAAPFDRLRDPRLAIEETNIAGLRLARLTIQTLPSADVSELYRAVAALQHDIGVIRAFAPLPLSVNPAVPTTGYDDVRRVALARLFVANVPSIQVDWALYGPKLAQVALTVGADDLDSVSALDDAGQGRRRAPLEEVRRNIRAASLDPCERDGRFDARS
jgi:aminodeoxyfutalosine synthase